ncbi:hypothetical protein JYK04_07864 [Streptomyces nojiriensis]|nr:hypothetical protein JYK04_07864 [Streptomyces nojiriensis]
MTCGGYQGPSAWDMEKAYRRAQGEFIPPDEGDSCSSTACCCLLPAIAFALFMVIVTVVAVAEFQVGRR